jgi:hypothetical protein
MATCPVHPGNAQIQQVSVVYAARSDRLLQPGPVLKSANRLAWAGTGCGVAGMVAIWLGAVIGKGAAAPALIAAFCCFAYALALYGWAGARRARLTLVQRGMAGAMAVWRAAWYCDLCDGVFFQPGTLRQGPAASVVAGAVTEGEVLTPAAFHRLVWRAGRYGGALERIASSRS